MTKTKKVPTVIVAGFGSWIKTAVNPAGSILDELRKQVFTDSNLICLEVSVESDLLYSKLEQTLLEHRPDIWIGLGVAVGSSAIRAEMVGLNMRHFNVPDNKGEKAHLASIVEGAPLAYLVDLPNELIVNRLREEEIPAVISFHAGTHLCNQMVYSVHHLVKKHGLETKSGFLHVPQSTRNAALEGDISEMVNSMSSMMMANAARVAINCVVDSHNGYNNDYNDALGQTE